MLLRVPLLRSQAPRPISPPPPAAPFASIDAADVIRLLDEGGFKRAVVLSTAYIWGQSTRRIEDEYEIPLTDTEFDTIARNVPPYMAALARFQDENGMWRNVVDRPGAYPEYSATAMIATAMLRGVRHGWIDRATYEPLIDKAWKAILARTGTDGRLVDVCESTGTRGLTDLDYLRRTAILGRDDRGGGMAMFFATELAGLY